MGEALKLTCINCGEDIPDDGRCTWSMGPKFVKGSGFCPRCGYSNTHYAGPIQDLLAMSMSPPEFAPGDPSGKPKEEAGGVSE